MQSKLTWEKVPGVPGFYRMLRADGAYNYRFRYPGERKWTSNNSGLGLTEAKRWRNKELGADEVDRIKPDKATFELVAARTFETYRHKPGTLKNHERNLRDWLAPLAKMRVQEIDKHELVRLVVKPMEKAGRKGNTIHNVLMTASLVFAHALDARPKLIGINPVTQLQTVTDKPSRESDKVYTILTGAQFEKLLEHAGRYKAIFALMGYAGLRVSEACGLIWGEVLFDHEKLNITKQIGPDRDRVALKTRRSKAIIKMPEALVPILAKHSLGQVHYTPDDFVCQTVNGGPYEKRTIERALEAACVRANIPRITPHELRHFCGSWILLETKDLTRSAGHLRDSVAVFQSTYAHEWQLIDEQPLRGPTTATGRVCSSPPGSSSVW